MTAAVEVSNLTLDYGSLRALDDVGLAIAEGEVFGLIGPNGAGKTTLIRALVGSLRATGGTVRVLGLDPRADRWGLRSRLGYMPQSPALYDDLAVRSNLRFFLAGQQRHPSGDAIEEALEFVDLSDRADDRVHTLSGGMKQRLSLACAIVNRPELLVLDEPTSGVDPELRASFWQGFRRLTEAGTTILVSTHQMDEAFVCDRIAVLSRGRVVASDRPRELAGRGRALARIWRNGTMTEHRLSDYRVELPRLLVEPADRVEIDHETLQDVVLSLIRGSE